MVRKTVLQAVGAAKAVGLVCPEVKGKLTGMSSAGTTTSGAIPVVASIS